MAPHAGRATSTCPSSLFSAVLSGHQGGQGGHGRGRTAERAATASRTILFIDEIHRFNKAQQDAFLPYVEEGDIILFGVDHREPLLRGHRRAPVPDAGPRPASRSTGEALRPIIRRRPGGPGARPRRGSALAIDPARPGHARRLSPTATPAGP
ncbi:MAG: sigma 54-interacting transcriptional regulator [Desulfobacterales bacterium]|nr:sigma 54-interacting transcriptional regulator [Desulfobacterales bacterium]